MLPTPGVDVGKYNNKNYYQRPTVYFFNSYRCPSKTKVIQNDDKKKQRHDMEETN